MSKQGKTILIVVIIVVVLLIAVVFYVKNQAKKPATATKSTGAGTTTTPAAQTGLLSSLAGLFKGSGSSSDSSMPAIDTTGADDGGSDGWFSFNDDSTDNS